MPIDSIRAMPFQGLQISREVSFNFDEIRRQTGQSGRTRPSIGIKLLERGQHKCQQPDSATNQSNSFKKTQMQNASLKQVTL